jgi:ankyrin repeat protein
MNRESTLATEDRSVLIHIVVRLRDSIGTVAIPVIPLVALIMCWTIDPNCRAAEKAATLFDAARRGDVSGLERAVASGVPIDAVESGSTMTALMWAARGGRVEAAEWLLAHGAQLNASARGYGTPLANASATEREPAMVRFLLKREADPNVCTPEGHSPLMFASDYGNVAAVQLLIRAGADVNARDDWGNTPLSSARQSGDNATVTTLIAAGATALPPASAPRRPPPAVR